MKLHILNSIAFLLIMTTLHCQTNRYKIRTVAFYNVENLFDTIDDPDILDDDYTKEGKNNYTSSDYHRKIENIAYVVAKIGAGLSKTSPAILGLAEIENHGVLEDLIRSEHIKPYQYQIIHFDSPDRRGIDVALIYQEKLFKPTHQENVELRIWDEKGIRIFTRDLLWVSGIMDDEVIHIIVNHWPSRRGGRSRSDPKRMKAAFTVRQIIGRIYKEQPRAKIIIMGDFNDDPFNKSLTKGLIENSENDQTTITQLFNPMEVMYKKGYNTLAYRDGLNLFDQVIMSIYLLREEPSVNGLTFLKAGIYNPEFMTTQSGKYKGYPYRSFNNNKYVGGFSDHYPVYVHLIKPYSD